MQRAMAKKAEAERERRAKIVAAEGEYQASVKLGQAADIITQHPVALQLRTLQTMAEIATEKNSTIIFPAQFMRTAQEAIAILDKDQLPNSFECPLNWKMLRPIQLGMLQFLGFDVLAPRIVYRVRARPLG
jgi:hypothetical protein